MTISQVQTIPLKDFRSQNTKGIRGLSEQCAAQTVAMGKLVKVSHANLIDDGDSLVHLYLQPEIASALLSAAKSAKVVISCALRTLPQQYALKRNLPGLVANVGRSNHGGGGAIDVVNYSSVRSVLQDNGFIQSYPGNDPVHFDHEVAEDYRSISILAFQQVWNMNHRGSQRLSEDGIYGNATAIALANSPISGFETSPVGAVRLLHEGLMGQDVGKLQLDLRALGFFKGVADGVFRPGTTEAVKEFQRQNDLTADGYAGSITQAKVKEKLAGNKS
jgi:N-acetylmuramoyl-L-alanine amidase